MAHYGVLPPGWEAASNYATGSIYYYNPSTGETSWEPPPMQPAHSLQTVQQSYSSQQQFGGYSQKGYSQSSELPPGWEEVRDASGASYYQNLVTGKTTWERPAPIQQSQPPAFDVGGDFGPPPPRPYVAPPPQQQRSIGTPQHSQRSMAPQPQPQYGPGAYGQSAYGQQYDEYGQSGYGQQYDDYGGGAAGWEEVYDDATGAVYYFNASTGQTSWDPPGVAGAPSGTAAQQRYAPPPPPAQPAPPAQSSFGYGAPSQRYGQAAAAYEQPRGGSYREYGTTARAPRSGPQPAYSPPQPAYKPPPRPYSPPQPAYSPPQPAYNPPQPAAYNPPPQPYSPLQPAYSPQPAYRPPPRPYSPPQPAYNPPQPAAYNPPPRPYSPPRQPQYEASQPPQYGAGPAGLAGPWEEAWDEYGQLYYLNAATGETSWEPPPAPARYGPPQPYAPPQAGGYGYDQPRPGPQYGRPPPPQRQPPPYGAGSSYGPPSRAPAAYAAPMGPPGTPGRGFAPGGLGSDWSMYNDESGSPFYYNARTGETTYERPPEPERAGSYGRPPEPERAGSYRRPPEPERAGSYGRPSTGVRFPTGPAAHSGMQYSGSAPQQLYRRY